MEFDLSCIIGIYDISFSRKYDVTLRRKMKVNLSQKNTRKYDIFFKCSKKLVFSKRTEQGHDLSCTAWKGDTFYLICSTPPAKKNQRQSYPAKMHLKGIDIPDRHPRKSSSNSLHLHGDLYRRFHILLFNKKTPGNLTYRTEV